MAKDGVMKASRCYDGPGELRTPSGVITDQGWVGRLEGRNRTERKGGQMTDFVLVIIFPGYVAESL